MGYAIWIALTTVAGVLFGYFAHGGAWFAGSACGFGFGVLAVVLGLGAVRTITDVVN